VARARSFKNPSFAIMNRMLSHKELEEYVLSMPNARLEYPFGENAAVYKVGEKIFAIIAEKSNPVRISLKCDHSL
jgi:predicted DNA-binding protein (MmcQ/YjbR family)